MRTLTILGGTLLAVPALAQQACKPMRDPMLRLACYEEFAIPAQCTGYPKDELLRVACVDRAYGRPLTPARPEEARQCQVLLPDKDAALDCYQAALAPKPGPKPAPENLTDWSVQVREQSLAKFAKLNEAAMIGYKHESGRGDPLIKAAVLANGPTVGFVRNWNWFGSLDLNVDLSAPAKQRANSKSLGVGARGSVFDLFEDKFAFDSTVRLSAKYDSEQHTRSTGLVISNLAVIDPLLHGAPWDQRKTAWQIIPAFGLAFDRLRKVEPGKTKGKYSSLYGGVNIAVWPGYLRRTQLSVKLQRYVDLSASGGLEKRYLNYATFGAEYYLYDPTTDSDFTPRIALLREIGDDPLSSTADKNRTLLVFKFTLN